MELSRYCLGWLIVAMVKVSISEAQGPAGPPGQGGVSAYHQAESCEKVWDQWGQWSECNGHCGQTGRRARYRNCITPPHSQCNSGHYIHCQGKDMESGNCKKECNDQKNTNECHYDDRKGGWGDWACWSKCKNGMKIRYRKCNKPEPIGEHSYCHGNHDEKQHCTEYPSQNPYPSPSHYPEPYPPAHNPNPYPPPPPSHNPYPSPSHNPDPYPPAHNPNPYPPPPPSYNPNPYPPPSGHNPYPPAACVKGQDIIFAVDSSGSIGHDDYSKMTDSLLSLIKTFDLENRGSYYDHNKVRTGIIVYSDHATPVKQLDDFNVPHSLRFYDGATNTAAAIDLAKNEMFQHKNGDRSSNPNVLVILTDGQSTDVAKTYRAARYAKDAGIKIIAVGIGPNVDKYELQSLTEYPNKDVYYVNKFDQVPHKLSSLFKC